MMVELAQWSLMVVSVLRKIQNGQYPQSIARRGVSLDKLTGGILISSTVVITDTML